MDISIDVISDGNNVNVYKWILLYHWC